MQKKFGIAVVTAILPTRLAAQSQGIPGGMEREAAEGSAVGGPVDKVVGDVPGGARGLLGANERLAFREYVMREGRYSCTYANLFNQG